MSKRWFRARDYFLGSNYRAHNYAKALAIARTCQEEDARWLCSLFPDGANGSEHVLSVLQEALYRDQTGRAQCFYALSTNPGYMPENKLMILGQAASHGHVLAIAMHASYTGVDCHDLLTRAAASGERDAMHMLAWRWQTMDYSVAFMWYKRAADLGCVHSMFALINLFGQGTGPCQLNGSVRLYYMGKALSRGCEQMRQHMVRKAHSGVAPDKFLVGEQLAIRRIPTPMSSPLASAAAYYMHVCGVTRGAILCWTGVARRLGVVRDIRRKIAELLWRNKVAWASE